MVLQLRNLGVANGRVEERLKDAVAQLKPDIVIIAGELKDKKTSEVCCRFCFFFGAFSGQFF